MNAKVEAFGRILSIMDDLREKCPWDRKQTIQSLRKLTIEEVYELADAIVEEDMEELKEELGDVLLHIVFYSKIGEEKGAFDIADVINAECDKLIERHPHIYGDVEAADEEAVKRNWEKIKLQTGKKSVLGGVPNSLPAMIKALRMQEKAKQVGFEWDTTEQLSEKVQEELDALHAHASNPGRNQDDVVDEFGDVLFSLINFARFLDVDPELALARTNKKFKTRFEFIEKKARSLNRDMSSMSLEEMDALWNEAKTNEL
jgi:XTP/dITP diphosphohydrolase